MAHKMLAATAETLAGTRVLTATEVKTYAYWTFDPGGAGRAITLPDAADVPGEIIFVKNTADAAEILTISGDSATVATPTQAESAILWSNGTVWAAIAGANS